jgi:hypothetical protein
VTIARGFIKIRVKHFPAIFLVANTVSGVVFGTDTALVLAWLGFLVMDLSTILQAATGSIERLHRRY